MSWSMALLVASISCTVKAPLLSLMLQCRDDLIRSMRKPCASEREARTMTSGLTRALCRESVLRKSLTSRAWSLGARASLQVVAKRLLSASKRHAAKATISSDSSARLKKPWMTDACGRCVDTLSGTRLARWVAYTIHSTLASGQTRIKEVATA